MKRGLCVGCCVPHISQLPFVARYAVQLLKEPKLLTVLQQKFKCHSSFSIPRKS